MIAGWVKKTIAADYRKPLCYALSLHGIVLVMLLLNFHPHHRVTALAMPQVQVMKAMMINSLQLQPIKKIKPAHPAQSVVHHQVSKPQHKKVVIKKPVHKKSVHHTTKRAEKTVTRHARHHTVKSPTQHKSVVHKKVVHAKQPAPSKTVSTHKAVIKKVSPATKKPEVKKTLSKQTTITTEKKVAASHTSAAVATQHPAAMSQAEINRYKIRLTQAISHHWIIPAGADPSLSCQLLIIVAADGGVLDVTVARPSGNPALDRTAVTAVLQASPLPVPSGVDFSQFHHIYLDNAARISDIRMI